MCILWTWGSSSNPPKRSSKSGPSVVGLTSGAAVSASTAVSDEPDNRSSSTL